MSISGWMGLAVAVSLAVLPARAAGKVKVLIVDGQNNHNYRAMTPFMKAQLEKTGRFAVDVSTSPPQKSPSSSWDSWRPAFGQYDVVMSNYNGEPWPEPVQKAFLKYVWEGGGAVIVHAANNAFPGWTEYDRMIGLGWRPAQYSDRVFLDDEGRLVRLPPGRDVGAGHGAQHEFQIRVRMPGHPVTKDMPLKWMHAKDELYHGQRGPAESFNLLATAYSDPKAGGTGKHEPMAWWVPYGKGKVFTTVMGHVSGESIPGIECVGFVTVMNRACEWVATGAVTIPVPADFPTETEVRLVPKR
ncbi:MAG: ThuA domain-containing protein [Verrucomicrobia bacterium]|nr:MAG: ThuA domain-containing protein [Verrucomicrobiota bacterium]